MFQTLIGTVGTSGSYMRERGRDFVSNPYRYGRNGPPQPPQSLFLSDVSNPYRYGRNLRTSTVAQSAPLKFQTLIGTVGTGVSFPSACPRSMFQTLIGTVGTPFVVSTTPKGKMFQTLIGTVGTCASLPYFKREEEFQTLIGTVGTFFGTA